MGKESAFKMIEYELPVDNF